ncbi:hypothetical protein ACFLRQ_02040 [Bacteroidota bacterium]
MKPERMENIEQGMSNDEVISAELSEDENLVLNLLTEKSPVDLNELKGKTGLSNKKWDLAIKGLHKLELVKVAKNEEGLWVEVV